MSPPARSRRPSLEQVAALAGVSRATVSRVVNGATFVDSALRERVNDAVRELGYQPNLAARALVTGRTDTIALVASEPDVRVFSDPFFARIVRGVTAEANAADLQVVLLMAHDHQGLERVRRYVRTGTADGVLLISQHQSDDPTLRAMVDAGIPLVIGGRPHDGADAIPYVDNDNVHGAGLAARRLLDVGRRRIATLAGPADMTAGLDRLQGFREELGDHFDADLVEHADFTQEGGRDAAGRLLARAPDVDGIFAASDLIAMGAIGVLRQAGRRVPDDVSVIGFDDIQLAASMAPALTTVRQDTERQGRAMVRLLLARIRPDHVPDEVAGIPSLDGTDRLVLPVELVVRASA